eukprot:sb/3479232/
MLILAGIFQKTIDNYLPGATNEMQIGSVVPCSQVLEQFYPKINNGAEACIRDQSQSRATLISLRFQCSQQNNMLGKKYKVKQPDVSVIERFFRQF